jgi:hypothetical protein
MDVAVLTEGLEQARIAREVGHDAQLDLRVIGSDDLPAGRRDESFANSSALRRANRNVLQVGIR